MENSSWRLLYRPHEGSDKRTDEYTLSRLLEEIEQYL